MSNKRVFSFSEPAIGTDGEFFLKNIYGDYVSSVGRIGGRKERPVLCEGGGYLEDCVTVEINANPVPESAGSQVFSDNIAACIAEVKRKAATMALSVDITPAALFQSDQLVTTQASESGCSVSYNAWTNRVNKKISLTGSNYRYASGDIHISWPDAVIDKEHIALRKNLVKALDLVIGMTEVAYTPANERNAVGYGWAGIHRPTSYGVEYKTPGNFWMRKESTRKWVFDTCLMLLNDVRNDYGIMNGVNSYGEVVNNTRRSWRRNRADEILATLPSCYNNYPGERHE